MGYQRFTTGVFGGLNEDENPHAVQPGELVPPSQNVARFGNLVGTRPGLVAQASGKEYENALTSTPAIQGMVEWRSGFDQNRKLIVVADVSGAGRIWFDDASQYPAGTPTMTTGNDNLWTFAIHQNQLWGAGGANRNNSGSDDFWYLDDPTDTGTGPAVIASFQDSLGATLRPRYVFEWNNYLLICGLQGGTVADNNPTTFRYATFASDLTVAGSWPAANTIGFDANVQGVDTYGANFSTGFGRYRDNRGDFLMCLGSENIYAAQLDADNDFKVTDAVSPGCVGQKAYVQLGLDSGDAIYVSRRGIHSLRQSQEHGTTKDEFLSWKIRVTFDTINRARMDTIVGAYDWRNGRVVFAVPTGSNTFHDTLLVLDVKDLDTVTAQNARWYKWILAPHPADDDNTKIQDMIFARDEDNNYKLMIATRGGKVLEFAEDAFSDVGSAYTATARTSHRPHGSILESNTIGETVITLVPGGSQNPTYKTYFDYGARSGPSYSLDMAVGSGFVLGAGGSTLGTSGGLLGSGQGVIDQKIYTVGTGRTISHEVSHDTADEPWRIARIDYEVDVSGENVGDVAT